jgi:hypothetical protein
LYKSFAVTQINKYTPAMIAAISDPSEKNYLFAHIRFS